MHNYYAGEEIINGNDYSFTGVGRLNGCVAYTNPNKKFINWAACERNPDGTLKTKVYIEKELYVFINWFRPFSKIFNEYTFKPNRGAPQRKGNLTKRLFDKYRGVDLATATNLEKYSTYSFKSIFGYDENNILREEYYDFITLSKSKDKIDRANILKAAKFNKKYKGLHWRHT